MIHAKPLLPELSHISETSEGPVFVTVDGRMGCIFECRLIDLEAQDAENRISALERLIEAMPDGFTIRVIQRATPSSEVGFASFRSEAIRELGFVERRTLLSIEQELGDPLSLGKLLRRIRRSSEVFGAEGFLHRLPRHELVQLGVEAQSVQDSEAEFAMPQGEVIRSGDVIDEGAALIATVRIHKPGVRKIGEASLAALLDQLPMPFEVAVSATKVPRHRADFRLRSQLARGQIASDPVGAVKQEATEKALEETALYGGQLCELEWLLILRRPDENGLRRDLEKARSVLASFGDAMIETVGSVPSYAASRIGARTHFTFIEDGTAVPFYLPILGFGEAGRSRREPPNRTLLLHRLDGSIHSFDQFDSRFLAYNALICGKTGSGKSVLANALSSALMQDEHVRMIKIDVGGSYKKECEVFGGEEVDFRMDSPAGVNPFRVFQDLSESNEAIEVVGEFLSTLIREEEEKQIPKAVRAHVEERLKDYASRLALTEDSLVPSLDHFLANYPDLPRRTLLARWATGGVFENVLKERGNSSERRADQKYRYFNFENIQAAANRDFAEGVMAAVITMVNLEMLRLGDRSKGQTGDRLVLFCDETKFFIERFAHFFLLTAANFRKFGHGLILMLQNIRNAEITLPDGKTDMGLILNSPIRFFLQADTDAEYLKKQFQFDEQQLRVVVTNPYRGREYREAVLQDDTGTRVVRLYLTAEEYWRMTSTKEDVDKFNKLRVAVPELSAEEAIRCLAVSCGR